MTIYLKNGHTTTYDEVNKVQVHDDLMTISTFKSQYIYIKSSDLSSFELNYPQAKSAKAFAIFKQIISELGGVLNDNDK